MEINNSIKERFCKTQGIPIKIYNEPYFTEKIEILDPFYNTKDKYKSFLNLISKLDNNEDYYKIYNDIKNNAISYLEEKLVKFKQEDFNKYNIKNQGFSSKDIYNETNVDKVFLSIDMIKANFTALKHYDKDIFPNMDNYEDFIKQFTDEKHFIESKYIRQVIFGNQSPKRQVKYEKYLMDKVLSDILEVIDKKYIVSFSNDEIVIEYVASQFNQINSIVQKHIAQEVNLRLDKFKLEKLHTGYKKVHDDGNVEFKGFNSIDIIFAIRKHLGQKITENDKVFIYENKLAKFI